MFPRGLLVSHFLKSLPSLATEELVVLGLYGITARLECLLIAADHNEGGKIVLVNVRVSKQPDATRRPSCGGEHLEV